MTLSKKNLPTSRALLIVDKVCTEALEDTADAMDTANDHKTVMHQMSWADVVKRTVKVEPTTTDAHTKKHSQIRSRSVLGSFTQNNPVNMMKV
jgi:hypothetical protein